MSNIKMLQLTQAYGGRPVYFNPMLISSVAEVTPESPSGKEMAPGPEPGEPGYYGPTLTARAYVMTAGDSEGVAVVEDAATVAEMWAQLLNG
jgi:hypothetical protein